MIVKKTYKGVIFEISSGLLMGIYNPFPFKKDIFIPSALPNGPTIDALGPQFVRGGFKTITISDDITQIHDEAFGDSDIREVVWPAGCYTIPKFCFAGSKITKITNIGHVSKIEAFAFGESGIKEIDWPSGIKTIPWGCFYNSKLESIANIQSVTIIEDEGFYGAENLKINLSDCDISSLGVSCLSGVPRDNVHLPYYLPCHFGEAFEPLDPMRHLKHVRPFPADEMFKK